MPATTVPFSLPYPLPGDPTRVERDIQLLAEATDTQVTALLAEATAAGMPATVVVQGGPQPIPNNVLTALNFNTAVWDNANYSHLEVRQDLIQVEVGATYVVQATAAFAPNATGLRRVEVRDGVAATRVSRQVQAISDPGTGVTISASEVMTIAAGEQFLSVYVQQVSGTTLGILSCELSAVRVG